MNCWIPARFFILKSGGRSRPLSFLQNIPLFEQSGLVVRIPDWWKSGRPPRPQVTVRIGDAKGEPAGLRRACWISMCNCRWKANRSPNRNCKRFLQSASGLVLLKGKWVEVDRDKLQEVLNHWKKVQASCLRRGSLLEGLRLLSGFDARQVNEPEAEAARAAWSSVVAGDALKQVLEQMQQPEISAESEPGPGFARDVAPVPTAREPTGSGL